jgi:hypothetical protein
VTRHPTAHEVRTAAEAITLATRNHPNPAHDLASVPGVRQAAVVFCHAAIHRAIGLVKAYRSNLARWERQGRRVPMPGLATVERFSVTVYQGLGRIVRVPQRSYLKIKLWDGSNWAWTQIPMRTPARAAEPTAASEETRATIEAVLAGARRLARQRRTREAKAVRERLRPLPWEIAQESATVYRHAEGWAVHVPFVRTVPVKNAEDQRATQPGLAVTTVDQGENNLAVAAAWHGRNVTGTLVVRGRAHDRRRIG